jgi:hypothetical protein
VFRKAIVNLYAGLNEATRLTQMRKMKSFVFGIPLVLLLLLLVNSQAASGQQRVEPLTNASVIKLVRAGFKEKTVIAIIHSRLNRFDLSPDSLIELKRNGVTENTILAMLGQNGLDLSEDDWGDDPLFKRSEKSAKGNDEQGRGDGTSIFGSGGSSQSQVRDRDGKGSSEGDIQTNGSATVRILRPPSEQGAEAPVKLERTPTLNNDSVINLVEAGFSEGTIVKRIEHSPVEFDLSPPKLVELRKHRVSDPIIAAMTAAMNDSSSPKTNTPGTYREK